MALGVPLLEVHDEAAAVRARDVPVAVALRRLAEELLPPAPEPEPVRVLDRVPALVPEEPHAPLRRPALDLEHVGELEACKPRVSQVERNRDPRDAVRAVPLVGQPEVGSEAEPVVAELAVELVDPVGELPAADRQTEVAEPEVEEALVGPAGPLRLRRGRSRAVTAGH